MENLIGKKVYGIDGPGQACMDGLAGSVGVIVGEEKNRWGDWWVVEWQEGNHPAESQEPFMKHGVRHVSQSQRGGIGVYWE